MAPLRSASPAQPVGKGLDIMCAIGLDYFFVNLKTELQRGSDDERWLYRGHRANGKAWILDEKELWAQKFVRFYSPLMSTLRRRQYID